MRRFCTEFNETLTKTYVNEAGETKTHSFASGFTPVSVAFPTASDGNE